MKAAAVAAFTGKKAKGRGARGKSGKPGAEHLGALQRAHAAGDFKAAKIHALNYAKSAHQHSSQESPEEHAALVAMESEDAAEEAAEQETSEAPPPNAADVRARLAKIAASRKK